MTTASAYASPKPWFSVPYVSGGFRLFVSASAPADTFLTALHGLLAGQSLDYWSTEFDAYEGDWICWKITSRM